MRTQCRRSGSGFQRGKNLVAFRLTFPLFAALAVAEILVDHGSKLPRAETRTAGLAKIPSRSAEVTTLSNSRMRRQDPQQRSRALVHESDLLD